MYTANFLKAFPNELRQAARLGDISKLEKLVTALDTAATSQLSCGSKPFTAPITVLLGIQHLSGAVQHDKLGTLGNIAWKVRKWCHEAFNSPEMTEDLENAAMALPFLVQSGMYLDKKAISKSAGTKAAYKTVQMGTENPYDSISRAMRVLQYVQEAGIKLSPKRLQMPDDHSEYHRRQNAQDQPYVLRAGCNFVLLSPLPAISISEVVSIQTGPPARQYELSATLKSSVNSFLKNGA